ncbi:MAG: ferritin-like domain-containing protein [Nocardioidaceae bacterium]
MTALDALQHTLAGEHAAVYVYGVLGGRVSREDSPDLARLIAEAYDVHRARRGQLQTTITKLGGTPVAADVAYELTTPAETGPQLRREALGIEQRCATTYAAAVASTTGDNRRWAVLALDDAAVRGLGFGGKPEPFPGAGDLADLAVEQTPATPAAE